MTFKNRAILSILQSGSSLRRLRTPHRRLWFRDVTTVYYGVSVPDPYRYFEDPKDPGLAKYFQEQSAYTRQILDALPGRAALRTRIAQLDNTNESLNSVQVLGPYYFYLKRARGANTTKLYRRRIASGLETSRL